jgi:hypothetical protein
MNQDYPEKTREPLLATWIKWTVDAVFQGIQGPSEIILKMAENGWGGYSCLHRLWLEALEGLGPQEEQAENEECDGLDQNISRSWTDVYEKDFQQFLEIIQPGMVRFPQERLDQVEDRFSRFQAAMSEFMDLLHLPLKESLRIMRKTLGDKAKEGDLSEDFKEYYKMWLKILEGHYMILLKSPEYTQTLSRTLNHLEDLTTAKQELLTEALRELPVPTLKEMDELCQEIYLLKKKLKDLEKRLDQVLPATDIGWKDSG